MKDMVYRNIFPNNNIPKMRMEYKVPSFHETLFWEVTSLIDYANFSSILDVVKELEFNIKEQNDPANILIKKLEEISMEKDYINSITYNIWIIFVILQQVPAILRLKVR